MLTLIICCCFVFTNPIGVDSGIRKDRQSSIKWNIWVLYLWTRNESIFRSDAFYTQGNEMGYIHLLSSVCETPSRSRSYLTTDGQYVVVSSPLWDLETDINSSRNVSIWKLYFFWREDGSAICSVITQWFESCRTRNHTLLSRLRPTNLALQVLMYIPQDPVGPYINLGTGYPLRCLLRLAGLRWWYSNPPKNEGYGPCIYIYISIRKRKVHFKVKVTLRPPKSSLPLMQEYHKAVSMGQTSSIIHCRPTNLTSISNSKLVCKWRMKAMDLSQHTSY
jgi:hypothetical protein